MGIEDTIGYQNEAESCAVCGKNVTHGGGFSRIKHGEVMVNLCCPLCLETFHADSQPFMARIEKIQRYREMQNPAHNS